MYILVGTNRIVAILTILAIAVIFNLRPLVPGLETVTSLYNICLQPTTAINYHELCTTEKTFAFIQHRRDRLRLALQSQHDEPLSEVR